MADSDKAKILHDVEDAPQYRDINQQLQESFALDVNEFLRLLVEHFQKPLFQYLRAKIGPEYSNEDITDYIQTTFLRFYVKIKKHKQTSSEPLTLHCFAYLRTIAWHVFLDDASKKQKMTTVSLDETKEGQDDEKSVTEYEKLSDTAHDYRWQEMRLLFENVSDTIEQLEEPLRTIMVLLYKGWSANDISKRLNLKLNTVKSHIRRIRIALKAKYPEYSEILGIEEEGE